jgi:hypothetical protein
MRGAIPSLPPHAFIAWTRATLALPHYLLHFQTGFGDHPASNYVGVKRPEREADHSLLPSAKMKNERNIPSLTYTTLWHGQGASGG